MAMLQDQYSNGHVERGFFVCAFSPSSRRSSRMKPASHVLSDRSPAMTSTAMLLKTKGNTNNKKKKNDEDEDLSVNFWRDLGKKPGNLIMLPFVAIVGIDLLLNIVFITKRSIEYFLLGQAPSTQTWW